MNTGEVVCTLEKSCEHWRSRVSTVEVVWRLEKSCEHWISRVDSVTKGPERRRR